MAEFNLQEFTDLIREYLYGLFPYENDTIKLVKHEKHPFHIRDVAFMWLPTSMSADGKSITFDIGSDYAEENYPYYHILQDAQVIHKKNKGTKTSKGSQALIEDVGNRDYGRIKFNGKTYSREYQKNVRGERAKIVDKSTRFVYSNGTTKKINANANTYVNIHYKYIDKILDYSLPFIAQYYGMKLMRKKNSGLEEEYNEQRYKDYKDVSVGNYSLDIVDILDSFNEKY